MGFVIKTSINASLSLQDNLKDIEKRWNEKEVNKFKIKVNETLDILEKTPYTFIKWEFNENIRKVKVSDFITLFYSINENVIELLLFWDERQNPETLLKYL